jgi:hypothetical protein
MEDKLLGLYNDFKNAGLFKDTKDYGTFRQRMQGQGYQAQIYKVAKQNGADVGQFWQFQRNFGLGRWAGGSRQSVHPTKPLTTAQRAGQVAQEYKKKLQQKSGAYKEGANFVQANGYEGESLGDLIGDAWEGVKSVGRKIGNSVASHIGDYGGSVRTAAKQVNPNYGAKPSKETHQVLKNWDVLTKKDSQLTPAERAVASNMRTRMQRAQEQAARQEQQRTTPITRSRITPGANDYNETMQQLSTPEAKQARIKQQHEDDLNQMAYQGVGQNLGKDIFAMTDKAIDLAEQSSKDFFKGAEDALGFSRQYDPRVQKSIADAADMRKSTETIQRGLQIGLADKVQEYFSRPEIQKNVMDTAEKMNISLEEAVQKYYMPNLMQYAKDAVEQRQLEKVLPQSYFDYLGKNLSNNIVGMMVSNGRYSKEERQRRQRALAISEGFEEAPQMVGHETKYYKAGILARASGTGLNMLADSPFFGVGGTAADMAVNAGSRILARGLEKVGLKTIGKVLTPREMAFKAANMSTAQKIASGLMTGPAKSALNLGSYSFLTGGLQQISTGDDSSPAAVALAAIESGVHGMKTGAMFGFSGSVMHPWVSKYGITGLERNAEQRFIHGAQKVGATAAGLGVEAGTMMVADHLQDDKEMSFAQWLEDGVTVMAFKLGEPRNYKHVGSILHGLTHNTSKTPITLTKDERNELINSTSGKNLMDAFLDVSKASRKSPMYKSVYKDFMADPEVSRSTKEKVNAALGMPSQNYKISQRSVNDVKNKQILEYASDGTLLTRTSYKNAEERRDILYRQKTDRDNMHVLNLVGIAKLRGRQLIDDDGKVSRIAADFLQGKGYDINKEATDPKNAEMIANLQNPKHELYLDWIKYADEHNQFTGIDASINEILKKHPLKRTDEEVAKLKEYSQNLEAQLFPANKLHPEESNNQGRSVAEDNNIGTEQPNGEAVKQELNGLRQAEAEMDALIRDNDVFSQNFKKLQSQGLTNPQIYDWMVQQGGLTVEQLEPFAHYINANARVEGMQEATKQKIEETVSVFAQDWSYHGTLNGQPMNGEQALYVQDSSGRTLLVGSGDVAFDQTTGRAKEGSGDMLVCLDPNTKEMVYVKADEVTLFQNQPIDQFAAEYRQRLQMKNSEPYNQAAQEQAMLDAAKPQPKEQEAPQDNTTKSEDSTTKEGDLTKVDTTSGEDNTTNENLAPQEQPQQEGEGLKFKDGTSVPVDANGEPDFLKMTPEQGAEVYKMLFEEDAPMQIDSDIKTLEKDLEKVKASKYEGASVMERAAARKKVKEAIALAEAQVEKAKAIKAAMEKKPEAENTGVGTAENAGQYEKERQQGYREGEGGVIYHRQKPEEVGGIRGKEVTVAFSPTEKVAGHVKLVELDTVQASHNNGQLNLLHFGPDWQPKDRSSQASRVEAEKIAGNIDPEQITGSNNAFIGSAPSVNERHETIQGNNRVDALKEMYASHPEQAAKYKQWLIDHAAEFGLNAEDIKKMKKPVIVNELPVDDATAKKLGQMMASGFESGGKRIPEISATINKLGDKMENLANVLLSEGTLGEDAKLSDLINQNSKRALEFLNKNGFIDNTEYENLATDVVTRRQWLESVLKASLFDGNKKTEAAFNTLPGNAQKAVLATFMRDRNSKDEDRIKENIQKSFEAYNELNQIAGFKNAKNLEQARAAIQAELLKGYNNVFGEAPIREKYTKFELELAALYKGLKDQKSLTGLFGKFYDAVQGKVGKELDAFSQENSEPLSKDEAIEKVFGINNKQENDRRRETESPSESGGGNGAEPAGDRAAGSEPEPNRGVKAKDEDKPNSAGFTPKEIRDHQEKLDRAKEKYVKALSEAKSEKEIKAAEDEFEFAYKDHQNMNGVLDEASVADMWEKELKSAKDSIKKDSKEPSADPMEGLKNAADAFHEEQKQKGEFAMNLKIGKARQDYAAAKESGDTEQTTKTAKVLKHLLDDKLKQEGKGLAERQKIIAKEIGKAEAEIIDKPWEQMDLEEREAVSSKNPLTESEINELTSEENKELIPAALAYLRGDKGNIINAISYFKIWNDVRNRHENVSDNSGTENGTQLDAADTAGGEGLGLGRGRESGRSDGPVDRGAGNEAAPGERNGRESNQNDTTLSAGEQGDKQGEGNPSGMGAVPAGSSNTNGGSSAGRNGNVSGGSGRESSNRPADTNAGRKPTAKQGTTFPDSTAERLKQERADYENKKKDFWARWKKAGQSWHSLALPPFKKLNLTPEQIEMLPELVKMHLNGAVLKIKEGIYKFNEWKAAMLAEEGEELKMIGLSDEDIDRFIEDYWNTPYEMDGETHTIREWSSIYGNQQLKKKLKEPLEEKYKRQMEAEPIEVKVGDMKNIEETLPYLLPQQQEDVLKAETQFFGKEHTDREHAYGKGYLFTNGTGTGKTYTGLGIAKRLAKQGKGRILFITPSQKKVSDWIKDGKNLGLDIKDLDSWAKERGTTATTESGEGMVITTFANFGLNKKLLETEWDAVIYDECHRIMENKKGTETARSMQHYMVTNRDENHCFQRLQSINPEYQKMNGAAEKFDALRLKEIERIKKEYKNSHPSATGRDVDNATLKSLPRDLNSFAPADGMTFPKLGKAYQDFTKARDAYNKVEPKLKEQAKDSWKNTKTIFLSATPFNTRENLDYVEGYIFKYPETDERGMAGRTQFYLNHFGAAYKFRYHRLEQSISNPDAVAKQEVAFSDYLQNTLGTMSGRIIDSPYDYSRDFPTVSSDHAESFNNAVQDTLKTKYLHDAYSKTIGDYNYGNALFETMKVSAAIDRIKQHLDLGRKVVIFHRRVESKEPLEAPFAYMLRVANEQIKMMKPGKERNEYIKECTEFRNKYADLLEWEKTLDYSMPREQIARVFGDKNVLFFSGKESKKVKDKAVDTFNDDDSGKNIIVIQEASGKEGISLHDTTSKHQRVCITLALPQSPITALQIEGRIYRIGNMSNAIFEYPILGLNSEMMLFGEKFNNQVSTTENLALGSQARNLRDSFANGILEHSGIVPVENQGVGGKEFDAATPSENDPFDNAVLDYYSNQKLNKNNREGSDYFPTPEPLGYKMVEWAGLSEGDSVLEPSAGHGAIARYVPKANELVSIEPSQSLFTKLQLKAGGLGRKFLNNTFENYALNNKHDVIVMNPPFGKAGTLAIQHVDKAFKHLDEGGRIVAIIPRGSTDKKFEKWYNEQKNVAMRAEVNLPDILFQQAGTRVACRVVVLDKITDAALRSKAGYPEKIDLSGHYDKIEDFFNDLRDIEMPERIIDTNLKMQKKAKTAVKDIMEINGVKDVAYGKTGIDVSLRGSWMNYGISFTGSDKPNYWRDKMANYYTKYDELQKLEYQESKQAVFDEMKKLSCKLADMTEDEMQRYIASKTNGSTHFRMELGKTFSDSKENFDGVRDRAVEEKGIVMPNLNKESVNVVPVEKHSFGNNIETSLSNAKAWAKDNLVTTGKSELPTMRDGTPYTISKKAVEKYLSESAVTKSENLDIHLSVLPKLTDVIHESIEAEIHPDYNKDEGGNRSIENGHGDNILVHRLYGAVQLDGKTYRVKTTMQEFRGGEENKPHSYEVTKIELLEGSKTANESDSLPLSSATNNSENELLDTPGTAVLPDSSPLDMTPSNSISVAKLLNGVEKSYDSGKKLLEESKNLTDEDTYFRNDNDSPVSISKDAPAVVKHVAKVAKATGGKVKMLQSVEEVTNSEAKARLEKGEKVEGWYDESTGEVVLYMPNVHDSYTAEKTVWHEIVGHKGMRELFGNDNYDKFLDDIYFNLDKPEYADLKKLVMKELQYNPFDYRNAIEEAIARMAEEGHGEQGLWNNLKNKVTNIFREIGYRVAPNTKDIKYLLWLAKNYSKHSESDGYFAIRRNALLHKLEKDNTPSIVERNGMYFDNDGKDHDYLLDLNRKDFEEATDGKVHFRTSPMTASKIEEYNRRLGTKLYAFKESTVDHMQSLQEAMEIISGEKHVWTDIPSAFNPLQAQNRIDSIVQQKAEEYDRKYTKPLDDSFKKVVSTMSGNGKDEQLRNAQLYMITKHGLERNRVFFVRDAVRDMMKDDITQAKALMKDWNDKQKDLADELEKGNIRFDEYLEQMDEWIRSNVDVNFVADEHDYSGFHGMQNIAKTSDPYDDKLAIDNVMSAESQMGSDLAKDFWTKKKAATDYVIDQEYYNGFIDNSDRDYLKGMFQWYVPLRKFDDTTAEDVYGYIGEKGDPSNFVGPVLANAKGRSSLSDINVMAQISAMAKSSLINGGKNVVKQHFARFVSAYENGNTKDKIFVEVNPWLEKHVIDGNEVWEEVTPQIPENATQQQISNILQNFEDTMQAKKATGDAKLASRKPNIGFKFQRAKNKSEHIVDVYIAGKKRSFVCQGNPRAAQALNGLLKDSGTRNAVTQFDAKVTRKIAQFNTSLNPDFMMSNMLRDLTFASANVTKEGASYTKDFLKEYAGNMLSIKNGKGSGNYLTMFRRYRDGKLDINNEHERMFKEFMDNGGQTGFVQIKKLESLIEEYDNLIKKGSKEADGWFAKKIKEGGTFIETANEIIENLARYSTYCTSRKHGRSVGRSIYDAKEVSTNFNRHGSGDAIKTLKTSTDSNIDKKFRGSLGFFNSWMKNHTQFYNAGVQGANLFFKNYKSAWKTAAISFGMLPLGLGIAQALINQFLINNEDEKDRKGVKDPYAELPEWKRRNNICIYTGHGNFKTVPIAIELRAFFGLGDIAAGYAVNDKLKSSTPIGYDILGQMAQLVPASDFLGHHSPSSSIKELGEDAMLAVTPTTISPAMELAFNRNWTGRPFYRDYDYLDKAPRWKRAYDNTNNVYMSINKWANQGTNGIDGSNADMKGNETLDYLTAPYAWEHLIDSYTGGMGSTIGRTYKTLEAVGKGVVSGTKSKEGFGKGFSEEFDKFDKNQIPLYRVFNYTPKEGQDMQRTRSKWYNYSDELKQTEYNIKQLKTNTPDVLKNIENNAKKFNFIHGEEGKAYNIWNAADNYIQKKKKILKRVSDPEVIKAINEDINRKMQEAVNDLDKLN